VLVLTFTLFITLFLYHSKNLLFSLIILEALSFFVLFFFSVSFAPSSVSDFFILALFSVFVIEGVIALSGMLSLVSQTGSDSVRSASSRKFYTY